MHQLNHFYDSPSYGGDIAKLFSIASSIAINAVFQTVCCCLTERFKCLLHRLELLKEYHKKKEMDADSSPCLKAGVSSA